MKRFLAFLLFPAAVFCYGQDQVVEPRAISVSASSQLEDAMGFYSASYLTDLSWRSWAEAAPGNGVGEYFTLTFEDKRTVAGFALKNGYGNLDHYGKNNRVKSFRIFVDSQYSETITVKDSVSFEQYAFKKPVECKQMRFVIDDVYPGTKYNDTCVAEIALLTEMVSDRDFYDNILFWLGPPEDGMTEFNSHDERIISVSDPEKIRLLDFLPFDVPRYEEYLKSKIALLDGPSSLALRDNLPRLDGATAMYPLYSSFVHAVYPEKELPEERYDYDNPFHTHLENWGYFPNIDLLGRLVEFRIQRESFYSIVQCNATSAAYQRLIDGEADIVFCYEPSQAEIQAAAEKGKRFNLTPVAKDAFVFIVNSNNTLSNITRQQIRNIYSGRVTNWKTITGVDEPVIAYQRPENSGSQTTLQSIMGRDRLMRPIYEGERIPSGMFAMLRAVASKYYNYEAAIGYTFWYYLNAMADAPGVKALAVDGVAPAPQTIRNNRYPFSQTVYAVTTGNESENTRRFIEWILSAQGQKLVEKTGYVPVN